MSVKIEIFMFQDCSSCNPTIDLVKSVIEELGKEMGDVTKIEIIDVKKTPQKL
ncbi:MAG: hypothetical protein ACE5K4_11630 [Candidatus Hydrothermarchaeota archaeon]